MRAFRRQRRAASAGVDGMTVEAYEQDLERNLRDLCDRVHSGRYRSRPVRRTYIPKADGGHRPLGVPALEDKVVQGAVAEVLSAIYEADFLDFSYGLRPGRSAHHALYALHVSRFIRAGWPRASSRWSWRKSVHRNTNVEAIVLLLGRIPSRDRSVAAPERQCALLPLCPTTRSTAAAPH